MKNILHSLVLVVLLSSCKQYAENRNEGASLPQSFDFAKMNLKTIGSVINPDLETTSTLYGNYKALQLLKKPESKKAGEKVLVLITWKQHDDPRWFGAKIPSDLKMIEVLKTESDFSEKNKISYQRYDDKNRIVYADNTDNESRVDFITSIKPAVMP